MAADMNARRDKHSTIAFTLPISCQVCLGKVKQPVLCPNDHVFCSQCMDTWLQRNQQCPACRVTINPANPVRQILGGLTEAMDDKERLSNPALRKARFDILYREYEEEFERLTAENNLLKTENNVLKQQLQKKGPDGKVSSKDIGVPKTADTNGLLLLTKKLQDAQRLYEKVKNELARTKEENNSLKEENVNINHENQKLRGEIANRSPHRYGRYTVSTLEAKIQSYEKEVGQLNKALEKSDKYIEEMQTELNDLHSKEKAKSDMVTSSSQPTRPSYTRYLPPDPPQTSGYGLDGSHKRQLFGDEGSDKKTKQDEKGYLNGESHKYSQYDDKALHDQYKSYDTKASMKSTASKNGSKSKRVTFDLPRDKSETMSFDLEMPSPMTSKLSLTNGSSDSPIKGVLKNSKKSSAAEMSDSFSLSKPTSFDDSIFETRKKPSTQHYSKDDDDLFRPRSTRSDLNDSFSLEHPGRGSHRTDQELDDTQLIQSELDELDISLTPDFTDCMKLLNRAEKKVNSHGDEEEDVDSDPVEVYRSAKDYLGNYRSKVDPLDHRGDHKSYSKPDTLTQVPKTRDDFKSYSEASGMKTETAYSSKYYNPRLEEDFKSVTTSKSSYSGTLGEADTLVNKYKTSQSDTDTYKYRTTSGYKSDLTNKVESEQYSVPTSASTSSGDRFSDNYNTGGGDEMGRYRPTERDLLPPRTTSLPSSSKSSTVYSSTGSALSKKPSLSGKPLSQSGFGRSPSVDNLFMSPKSSQSTGSRYATAEDIPSFKSSRLSLPSYSSTSNNKPSISKFSTGSYEPGRQGRALAGSVSETNQDYSKASLPPRPSRTRPYSDLGTTGGGYTRGSSTLGKGSMYDTVAASSTNHVTDPPLDTVDDIVLPPYVASSVSQPAHVSSVSSLYTSQPNSVSQSQVYASVGDQGLSGVDGGGDANNKAQTNAYNSASVSSGRDRPSFSYTDIDLGVNPRSRGDYKPVIRTRSASLDVPVSKILAQGSSGARTHAVSSSNDFAVIGSGVQYSSDYMPVDKSDVSALPFAGISARSSLESAYPSSRFNPAPSSSSRYSSASLSSSTSTTSYLPTTVTSISASTTYSTAHPPSSSTYPAASLTSTYPSSSAQPLPSSYSSKPLDPETKGGFSYLSNNSSLGEFSKSDSYLPEPKKRLFESSDDFDVSLSPIKSTRKM